MYEEIFCRTCHNQDKKCKDCAGKGPIVKYKGMFFSGVELSEMFAENAKLKREKEELIKMLEKVHEVNRVHFFNGHMLNDQILNIIQKHKKGGEDAHAR